MVKVVIKKVKMFGVEVPVVKVKGELVFYYNIFKKKANVEEFEEVFGEGMWERLKKEGKIEIEVSKEVADKILRRRG